MNDEWLVGVRFVFASYLIFKILPLDFLAKCVRLKLPRRNTTGDKGRWLALRKGGALEDVAHFPAGIGQQDTRR